MSQRWLSIIGVGEDGVAGLSETARQLIASARLVVGGKRHLALAAELIRGETLHWPSPIEAAFPLILAHKGQPVVVLASGDPSHYGIGNQLASRVSPDELLCLPQPSAFSLAAARLGWPLQEVAQASLHGRALAGIIRHLQPGARVLTLAWDGTTAAALAELLRSRGLGATTITVLEAMGGSTERIRSQNAEHFDLTDIAPLNTLALELPGQADAVHRGPRPINSAPSPRLLRREGRGEGQQHATALSQPLPAQVAAPHPDPLPAKSGERGLDVRERFPQFGAALAPGIPDAEFESDGQLTRREIRAIVLSSLTPRPGELLWDIGLGSGSIAIEWLLRHPTMRAIGVEADATRAARAARNAARFGTPDLQIVEGQAPAALAGLPPPDAVFIGGGASDAGVMDAAWAALRPGGRLVANAVTLEGEARLLTAYAQWGGDLSRIALVQANAVGTMHGWRPAMPITQYRVMKP
jgi:precorrin-6B C5,15-methyltransferase / cobalt-precorrin-6B C5,C15-methyltransferase